MLDTHRIGVIKLVLVASWFGEVLEVLDTHQISSVAGLRSHLRLRNWSGHVMSGSQIGCGIAEGAG
jgi:hypothetical protein